jgi:hypothetical protein
MAENAQSFKNHTKFDPPFHFFLVPVALVFLIKSIVDMVQNPGWPAGWHILFMIWAIVAMFKIRIYALKVQDRVIRLEERLRMQRVLPETLKGRITELTEGQCVALRFASDAELPALVEKTLGGNLKQKQIKQAIQTWRPDYFRV